MLLSESSETREDLGHGQGTSSAWYNFHVRKVSAAENSLFFLVHTCFYYTILWMTRKDMALSAISMNSALADKEFVLSLHYKLHVSTCINKPNDVHKHNQSIIHSINQSFLQKQQWNLPPWWNYLQVFIQRRSLIRQNRIRQILPFKLRPLTAHIRM